MNFLAHLFLSGTDPELLVGNLLGDFVKGRLAGRFQSGIERGIVLHRRIDSFASRDRHFIQSKRRIDASFGHYRGVLVDIFYDHFLSVHWNEYADVPLPRFLDGAQRIVLKYEEFLPERFLRVVPVIFAELLPSYLEVKGIGRALQRMSTRIARPNRLGEGGAELLRHYDGLCEDFRRFLPELQGFVQVEIS
jgi:acyl carrier protein phosphodiesterase